ALPLPERSACSWGPSLLAPTLITTQSLGASAVPTAGEKAPARAPQPPPPPEDAARHRGAAAPPGGNSSPAQTRTHLRPAALARHIAWSARWISSCGVYTSTPVVPVTPTLIVTGTVPLA